MADLRKEHQWIVGFPGDLNSTEVEVAGKKFLAIPHNPFASTSFTGQGRASLLRGVLVTAKQSGADLKIVADQEALNGENAGSVAATVKLLAKNCRRVTAAELRLLSLNIHDISGQLGIDSKTYIQRCGFNTGDYDHLPVLLQGKSSRMKVRRVYLIAARR